MRERETDGAKGRWRDVRQESVLRESKVLYIYIYIHVYLDTEREREREREREKETEREKRKRCGEGTE